MPVTSTTSSLRGRWRMSQGDHVVELGPGDYLRWDGIDPA